MMDESSPDQVNVFDELRYPGISLRKIAFLEAVKLTQPLNMVDISRKDIEEAAYGVDLLTSYFVKILKGESFDK